MSEHLPECSWGKVGDPIIGCICPNLRACYDRALGEARAALDEHIDNSRCCDGYEMNPEHALDAIDALKETA